MLLVLLGLFVSINTGWSACAFDNASNRKDVQEKVFEGHGNIFKERSDHGSSFGKLLNPYQSRNKKLSVGIDNGHNDSANQFGKSRRIKHKRRRLGPGVSILRQNSGRRRLPIVINIQNCFAAQCSQINGAGVGN